MGHMASRGKKAAFVSAAVTLVVLAVAAACWKDLLAQVHLLRIRRDPEYIYGIADRPEGSPEARAIARHFEAPSAREAFFRECVEVLLRKTLEDPQAKRLLMVAVAVQRQAAIPDPVATQVPARVPTSFGAAARAVPRLVTRATTPPQARVAVTGTGQTVYMLDRDDVGTSKIYGTRWLLPSNAEYLSQVPRSFALSPDLSARRLAGLSRLLPKLVGREYRSDAFPRFRFRVVPWEALAASTPYEVDDARFPIGTTLLVSERDPEDAARLLFRTLGHMNSSTRAWAAETLGALGSHGALRKEAAAAAQALEGALGDQIPYVRRAAEKALGQVRAGRP
jgi:hypothetical protein